MAGAHNPKKAQILNFMTKRKKCDKVAQDTVLQLIEKGVTTEVLLDKAKLISPHHLDDIAEERKLSGICGWVLCDNELGATRRQQYVIRGKKVFDITDRKNFCSSVCYTSWIHFKSQMMTSPLWLRDEEPTPTFTIYEPVTEQDLLHGILVRLDDVSLDDDENDDSAKPEKDSDGDDENGDD